MSGVNTSNFGAAWEERLQGIQKTLPELVSFRKLLSPSTHKWTGDYLEFVIEVARTGGIKAIDDGGRMPTAGRQRYVKAKAYRRAIAAEVQLTDEAIAAHNDTKNNAIAVTASELNGIMDAIAERESFFLQRNGTGVVATLRDASPSGATGLAVNDGRLLAHFAGSTFDIHAASGGAKLGEVELARVNITPDSNGDATIDLAAAIPAGAQGDHLVWKDSYGIEIAGLDSLIGTGSLQNVDPAVYPNWASVVNSNGGTLRSLTPALVRRQLAAMRQRAGSETKHLVVGSSDILREFEELDQGLVRLSVSESTIGGARNKMSSVFGNVEIVPDRYAPYNQLMFVDQSAIKRGVQKELHWRTQGGAGAGGPLLADTQYATQRAQLIEFCNYYITHRHTSGKISDLSASRAMAW
jgi:hypothetical protein